MIGQTVSHYEIIEKLGEGGMGVVYKAEDTKLKRTVALKFLPAKTLASEAEKTRFIHEAQAAAALNHPNICTIYEIDEFEGQPFIAMEFVEGLSLRDMIYGDVGAKHSTEDIPAISNQFAGNASPLPLDAILNYATQIAEGLQAAHEKGIIHRDMKCDNVMVNEKGVAKIMDFGLAKLHGRTQVTREGMTLGTISYMSPEQARGEKVDHRTDIWSFGVMLYEMLTGQLPFRGEYDQAIVYSIVNEVPQPVTSIRPEVPDVLARIIEKTLAKKADERYQNTDEMLAKLKAVYRSSHSGFVTSKPRRLNKILTPRFRKPVIISLAIMSFAAILAVLSYFNRDPEHERNRIVVAIFENQTDDPSLDYLGRMATDWATQGLSQIGKAEVVPSIAVFRSSETAQISAKDIQRMARVEALAKETDAGILVYGSYYLHNDTLQFHTQVIDAIHRKIMRSLPIISGPSRDPMSVLEKVRQKLMGTLAAYLDPDMPIKLLSKPPDFKAYQEYLAGLDYWFKNQNRAFYHFSRAAALDSSFVFPRLYMVVAFYFQDEFGKADSLVQFINRHREQLTPFERHIVDYYEAFLRDEHLEALHKIRQARKLDPKHAVISYIAGYQAFRMNYFQETLNIYKELDPSKLPEGFRIFWLTLQCGSHHMLGNYKEELRLARDRNQHFTDDLSVKRQEARALIGLGEIQEVKKLIDENLNLASQSGNPVVFLLLVSEELRTHGHKELSLQVANRAVDLFQNQPQHAQRDYWLLWALCLAESWDKAKAHCMKLAEDDPENITYKGFLGVLAARMNDHEAANEIFNELDQITIQTRNPWINPLFWQAKIASLLGEKDKAVLLFRELLAKATVSGLTFHSDMDFELFHDDKAFQALIEPRNQIPNKN